MFKIGLELFVEAGPEAIAVVLRHDRPVFLDLKLHDIPETVERAVARASALGVKMLTVHAAGGPAMIRRATERARREGNTLEIVAVTVLTSLDEHDLAALGIAETLEEHVERLAKAAWDEGVRSFVCSPREARLLRAALGRGATIVTPGVRPATSSNIDDQKRTMTAGEAVLGGADWIVVGRPIRDAADPLAAALAFTREVEDARAARCIG
jgi:orotidine-5'-phosphate decarboxylase